MSGLVTRPSAQECAKGDVSNTPDRSSFRASTNTTRETQTETGDLGPIVNDRSRIFR